MNQGNAPLLEPLHDIHAAAPPGWWPPAIGWWLLALLFLVVLFLSLRAVSRQWALRRRRRAWLQELAAVGESHDPARDPRAYLAALNRVFRAVALRAFPGTACARLEGEAWVEFITALMPDEAATHELAALARGPYEPAPAFDAEALNGLARTWVNRYG